MLNIYSINTLLSKKSYLTLQPKMNNEFFPPIVDDSSKYYKKDSPRVLKWKGGVIRNHVSTTRMAKDVLKSSQTVKKLGLLRLREAQELRATWDDFNERMRKSCQDLGDRIQTLRKVKRRRRVRKVSKKPCRRYKPSLLPLNTQRIRPRAQSSLGVWK